MTSLRARLFVVWLLPLAAAVAVGVLMLHLYRQSATARVARAEAAVAQGCERIADRYAFYATGWAGPTSGSADAALRRDLTAVTALALATSRGIEGGIWQQSAGSLAYAYPNHPGSGATTELPDAERPRIAALNAEAAEARRPAAATFAAGSETLVLAACPLPGPLADLTAWSLMRVIEATGLEALRLGMGVLFALVLGVALSLALLVFGMSRNVGRIEAALAAAGAGDLPLLPPTGDRELDRIVAALNTAGARLHEARLRAADLATRVAQAERLAALGRVAAGMAHEVRNPIAAMRIRAENALAGDPARRGAALEAILTQIARLDRMIGEVLAMTQPRQPVPEMLDLAAVLAEAAADHRGGGAAITLAVPSLRVRLDPALLRRTLDALLDNAGRHAPPDGRITLAAERRGATLRISVADSGPGVAPALRDTLFEPFVTGRAEGTGLGLAIARELAEAQGGRLALADSGPGAGAVFVLEFPCPPS